MIRLVILYLVCMLTLSCNAQDRFSFKQLIGRTIILPTYNNGNQVLPFVYQKESFYSGKFSKSKKIEDLNILGNPIIIKDITIHNANKMSKKYCLLFSINNEEYTLALPMRYSPNDKSIDIKLTKNMFYIDRAPKHYFDHIINATENYYYFIEDDFSVACYDANAISMLEELQKTQKTFRCNKMGSNDITVNRLSFKGWSGSFDIDLLYMEMTTDSGTDKREIMPLLQEGTQNGYHREFTVIDIDKDIQR